MATGRPRPVEIEIPPEAFAEKADITILPPGPIEAEPVDVEALERAAAVLAGALSPLVVAGGGVVLGDASGAVTALAERLQAPVRMAPRAPARRSTFKSVMGTAASLVGPRGQIIYANERIRHGHDGR